MTDRIIATGFNTGGAEGDLTRLAARLAHMEEIGCTGAEITAVGLDAVIACRLIPDRVAALRQIMAAHDLAYSMHAPIAINLMDEDHAGLMQRAAIVSLELAAEIGAKAVVIHPGRVHPKDWVDCQAQLYQFELEQLGPVADRAAELGVQIAYENISPNRRVIAGEETSYSLDPRLLAQQLDRLNHDAVMACLDISHAQQGAVLWGFDMIGACAALAPWIGHIHFSDSTGLPSTFPWTHEGERHFFGVGDMHAPAGFGAVDFEALAARLPVRQGTRVVIEIKRNFLAHAEAQTLRAAQGFSQIVNEVQA
ncbi:MAG: sugar phosphate isomerase/epimerase [Confluentimicrobium sp.]|uniref:sugar phosphate isomerase/epimerase family protein n=1 Tax=Actibacterium sp. TaxID=1872125 RepID=UPI00050DE51E|nr:sugar phosphate isomerase/epimerase family protein [Actibacterium sp.]KGB80429.1 xylose isomerase [Rhodovulum sp. NI22]MBC56860.1 sugar phosphate isomerase/epimerase [Actibacterium sp.]MDY6859175.1 sugar phosphate isomerase/epimerase family protein [Pseudomonadota bacterium]|tara:strand:+ start:1907 stop:2833 length:927 start_codon:yes stop_codon:yes gene_type:complete